MVFSSITFLFYFLPATMLLYLLAGKKGRNLLLLAASLFFYAWGEGVYLLLMIASIIINYCSGRLVGSTLTLTGRRLFLTTAVLANLGILGFFKYANFVTDNFNLFLSLMDIPDITLTPVRLPIGISFFTFQALSYIIDVYREKVPPQKNLISLALYISLFPQLIAGPIVRYHDIAEQLAARKTRVDDLAAGIQRFIFGMSKKVLLANPMGAVTDQIFALGTTELTCPLAWVGALCYTLQIYFDFSGYSDMAIGLGRMFGFRFLENFNYPYISQSVREFWRRWHISLSSWFRDYLYIPLGGNRGPGWRTGINLVLVFFLCGLWHGAAWTFVAWGLYHGVFLVLERTRLGDLQAKLWTPVRILFTMLIVIFGWVVFRADTLTDAHNYIGVMVGVGGSSSAEELLPLYLDGKARFELAAAMLFALPVYPFLGKSLNRIRTKSGAPAFYVIESTSCLIKLSLMMALCYFSIISLAAGVYNPFIYFRF